MLKENTYNVSNFTAFLAQTSNFDEMIENFKTAVPEQKKRDWYVEKLAKHIHYYGREYKNAFNLTPKQLENIRKMVFGTKKQVRITHY